MSAAARAAAPSHSASSRAASSRASARPIPSARPTTDVRPKLRAVAAPEQARSLAPLAWTCVLIIVGTLVGVLLLNTTMASGAYERRDLKIELANLHQERARLISELEANASPSRLADTARGLGMERAETRGFVSLAKSAVLQDGFEDQDAANSDVVVSPEDVLAGEGEG